MMKAASETGNIFPDEEEQRVNVTVDADNDDDDDEDAFDQDCNSARPLEKDSSRLSAVSRRYDLGNKGYLDENERMMRDMDTTNNGKLDMEEVYKIVADVRRQQDELTKDRKKILNMRRIIGGLVIFLALLALSMLGVSFAAAILAKDTKVNHDTKSLTDKYSGETVATVSASGGGYVTSDPAMRRSRRRMSERSTTTTPTTTNRGGEKERTERNASLSSRSPFGRMYRRKVESKRRRRRHLLATADVESQAQHRGLIPCFSRKCVNNRDNDNNDSDGEGDDGDLDTNRVDFDEDDIDWDDECDDLEGTISREVFDDIVGRVFGGNDKQTTYILSFNGEDGLTYQYTMYISESYHYDGGDGAFEDELIGIQTQIRLACNNGDGLNDIDGNCDAYQPVFIFEGCVGNGSSDRCSVFTCAYRGATSG